MKLTLVHFIVTALFLFMQACADIPLNKIEELDQVVPVPVEVDPVKKVFPEFTKGEEKTIKLRNTYYYLEDESLDNNQPRTTPILDMKGGLITKTSAVWKKKVNIEGSGKLKDGRIINYAGVVNGSVRYSVVKAPFGMGVGNCELVPYRTIAVDRKVVPYGTVVEILETKGIKDKDGNVHDGLWVAQDTGGAIKNDRVDLFLGTDIKGVFYKNAKLRTLQPLTVKILGTIPYPCKKQ